MIIKYPRTYHLPQSEGRTSDDKVLKSDESFLGHEVVVTEKMDGENTSLYRDYFHARSLNGRSHPSQNWVKGFWKQFAYQMHEGERICGENMYAVHSLPYRNLTSYFLGFSLWDNEYCLDWDSTVKRFGELGIEPVPVLFQGLYKGQIFDFDSLTQEGYCVRLADGFHLSDFSQSTAKYVRKDHVRSNKHWSTSQIVVNRTMT